MFDAGVEEVAVRVEGEAVGAQGRQDVDGADAGFGGAVDDAYFVRFIAVIPEVAMSVGVAYVKEVSFSVKA